MFKLKYINPLMTAQMVIGICLNSLYNAKLIMTPWLWSWYKTFQLFCCYPFFWQPVITPQKANDNHDERKLITSISLAPHLTELIYSAGGGNNLLAVSAYSNYPADALNKQIIGDAFHLNLELISELKPDVIFYWHNGTPLQTIKQLESLGFNLENIDITHLADIPQGIDQIANTLNTQAVDATTSFLPQLKQLKQQAHSKLFDSNLRPTHLYSQWPTLDEWSHWNVWLIQCIWWSVWFIRSCDFRSCNTQKTGSDCQIGATTSQ